jgi:hypothetical protein
MVDERTVDADGDANAHEPAEETPEQLAANERLRDSLAEIDPDMMLADGFERAIVGVASRCAMKHVVVYDRAKCIDILVERDGLSYEEAVEHFDFNVAGSYVGERTPLFLEKLSDLFPDDAPVDADVADPSAG